jgi:hypothetical protein
MRGRIFDPLGDSAIASHHNSVVNWIKKLEDVDVHETSFFRVGLRPIKALLLIRFNLSLFLLPDKDKYRKEIWPNIDLISMLFLAMRSNIRKNTEYRVRFIGTHESKILKYYPKLFRVALKAISYNFNVKLAAESKSQHELFLSWGLRCEYVPFAPPQFGSNSRVFEFDYAFFPGKPREGKGAELLFQIHDILEDFNLELCINQATHEYLQQFGNVEELRCKLIDNEISDELLADVIAGSSLVLLPYDVDFYDYRGSGFLSWAISLRKKCLILKESTFKRDLEFYGNSYLELNPKTNAIVEIKFADEGRLSSHNLENIWRRWLE